MKRFAVTLLVSLVVFCVSESAEASCRREPVRRGLQVGAKVVKFVFSPIARRRGCGH